MTLAHQLAMDSPLIQAEMIDANKFDEIAMRYNVSTVPRTKIHDSVGVFLGAMPEDNLVYELMKTGVFFNFSKYKWKTKTFSASSIKVNLSLWY